MFKRSILNAPRLGRRPGAIASRVLVIALLAPLLAVAGAVPVAAEGDLNRIVLRVNDEIVTLHDYESRKSGRIAAVLANPNLSAEQRQESLGTLGREVMYEMFSELLLLSRAGQLGVRIREAQIEERIQAIRDQNGLDTDEKMRQALAQSGLTLDQLRTNMRRDMIWSEVVGREVTSQIQVEEQELRAYYRANEADFTIPEQRWIQEVIVLENGVPSAEERQKIAQEILAKLEQGEDLKSAVASYAEAGQATDVIDLDWLTREEMDGDLAEAAFALERGGYSEPVSARGGLHICHVAGLRQAEMRSFDEVEAEILQRERGRRFDKALENYLAELESKSYIRENLPPEAVGYKALAGDYEAEDELEMFRNPELPTVDLEPAEDD